MATPGALISEPTPRTKTEEVSRESRSIMMKLGTEAEKSFMLLSCRRCRVAPSKVVEATGIRQVALGSLMLETTMLSRWYWRSESGSFALEIKGKM